MHYSMRKSQFLLVYDQLLYLNGLLQIMDRVFKKENRKLPFVLAAFFLAHLPMYNSKPRKERERRTVMDCGVQGVVCAKLLCMQSQA